MSRSCAFCDCSRPVRGGRSLCREHADQYADGLIDECPDCGRFKYACFELCFDCHGRHAASPPTSPRDVRSAIAERRSPYETEHSTAWEAGDQGVEEFYVYILRLDDGSFYAGQTRDLRTRLMEHRDGLTWSTKDRNPALVWFVTTNSRGAAEEYEAKIKQFIERNPRQIRKMILAFHDLISEADR